MKKRNLASRSKKLRELLVVPVLFGLIGMISLGYLGKINFDLHADVLSTSVKPFDGLVYPIMKSPNWVALGDSLWKANYDQIPADKLMDFPKYEPSNLSKSTSSLGWTDADKMIRNQKITFSTPYMGNYKLDGVEIHKNGKVSALKTDLKINPNGDLLEKIKQLVES